MEQERRGREEKEGEGRGEMEKGGGGGGEWPMSPPAREHSPAVGRALEASQT